MLKPKGALLAGGRQLAAPFGIFITPKILLDPKTGISEWTKATFIRSMREGRSPDGTYYFPALPYVSYASMIDDDLTVLWAYLRARPAQSRTNQAHQISFPFNQRWLLFFWRFLYFEDSPFLPESEKPVAWNCGAYLFRAVDHSGECHAPRTLMGRMRLGRDFTGSLERVGRQMRAQHYTL